MSTAPAKTKNWPKDHLGRWEDADYLSKFIWTRYDRGTDKEGFALAINAGWGKGKSFLLHHWHADLKEQGYPVVQFDAWKNDFTPEPLIGFISALNDGLKPHLEKIPKGKQAARKLGQAVHAMTKPAMSIVGEIVLRQALKMGVEDLQQIVESHTELTEGENSKQASAANIQKSLDKVFNSTLAQHKTKAQAIESCKEQLAHIISEIERLNLQLPLFIFIDELDRCRPNFAIELLEGIKHLFGVRGVYFVIAVNMTELAAAVKAVYGQDFNSRHYLRRFFDLEYTLEDPNKDQFAQHLFDELSLPTERMVWDGSKVKSIKTPADLFAFYSYYFALSLRDMQQAAKLIESACIQIEDKIHVFFLFFLATFYQKSPPLFIALKGKEPFTNLEFERIALDRDPNFKGTFSYSGRNGLSTSSMEDIIKIFYNRARDKVIDNDDDNYNSYFPQYLYQALIIEARDANQLSQLPSINKYFNVILNAGKFKVVQPDQHDEAAN